MSCCGRCKVCRPEWEELEARLANALAILRQQSSFHRKMELMPYSVGPTSEITLRQMSKRQADRIDTFLESL